MKCTVCGRENPEGYAYCSKCGSALNECASATQGPQQRQCQKMQNGDLRIEEKKQRLGKRQIAAICGAWSAVLVVLFLILIFRNVGNENEELSNPDSTQSPTATTEGSTTEGATAAPTEASEWSMWADSLPSEITDAQYTIETRTLYRYRTKELTTSSQSTLPGWELYASDKGDGSFGRWSEWSESKPAENAEREIESKMCYRFRNRETTTGTSPELSGWQLYDTTYAWGEYGPWSDWSTQEAYESDSRMAESKMQYRHRSVNREWKYTAWSAWGDWQEQYIASDSLTDVQSRTAYHYYYYVCDDCGVHMHGYGMCYTWAGGCGSRNVRSDSYHVVASATPYSSAIDFFGTTAYYIDSEEGRAFAYIDPSNYYYVPPYTQYRCRTRTSYIETSYGAWSDWGDTKYGESDSREEQSRKVYRYCDRKLITTYHFCRWTGWSDWSTDSTTQDENREVQSALFYRYREKIYEPTYYFFRWTDWSEWSTEVATQSDTVETEAKEQIRYRPK